MAPQVVCNLGLPISILPIRRVDEPSLFLEIVSWILAQALKQLDTGKNKNMKRRSDALVKSRQLLMKLSSPFLKLT